MPTQGTSLATICTKFVFFLLLDMPIIFGDVHVLQDRNIDLTMLLPVPAVLQRDDWTHAASKSVRI
jgi:hypothetical protein